MSERVIANVSWLFVERLLRLVAGLTIGVWMARYLGPLQFGQLNYAMAFVALFSPIASLGLKSIVIRSLVRNPANEMNLLGTAFVMRLLGGLLATSITIVAILLIRPGDSQMHLMVAIISLGMILGTSEVVSYWYESQVLSKYVVWVQNMTFLIGIIARLWILWSEQALLWFVAIILIESFISSIALLLMYHYREGKFGAWRCRFKEAVQLARSSWPLLLSGLSIMIYMKIDQVMLGELLGQREVGIYSVAVRISELWFMVPTILVSTVFPILVQDRYNSPDRFESRYRFLVAGLVTISIFFAITVSLLAGPIISLLFGAAYDEAADILKIHVWAGVFVSVGIAGSQWYLVHDMEKTSLHRTLIGALINVVANYLLIPKYGAFGAAVSTLLSQATATYIIDVLFGKTRKLFLINTKALAAAPIMLKSEIGNIR